MQSRNTIIGADCRVVTKTLSATNAQHQGRLCFIAPFREIISNSPYKFRILYDMYLENNPLLG